MTFLTGIAYFPRGQIILTVSWGIELRHRNSHTWWEKCLERCHNIYELVWNVFIAKQQYFHSRSRISYFVDFAAVKVSPSFQRKIVQTLRNCFRHTALTSGWWLQTLDDKISASFLLFPTFSVLMGHNYFDKRRILLNIFKDMTQRTGNCVCKQWQDLPTSTQVLKLSSKGLIWQWGRPIMGHNYFDISPISYT